MTDPCGNAACSDVGGSNHTTSYSYTDNYQSGSGSPPGNTNAYLTTIAHPTVNGVTQHEYFQYAYSDGQLTQSQDDNEKAAGLTTNYLYEANLRRLSETDFADGGVTRMVYDDTAQSVTTCKLINGTASATCGVTPPPPGWMVTFSSMDGMGQITGTQLTSDPDGIDTTNITYDGLGRVYTKTNPHRSSSSPTDGTATFTYDALGRTTNILEQDGSTTTTAYSGNQTTVTDEVGNQRTSQADSLGRITKVWEAPNVSGYNFETNYQYNTLNNLLCAVQKGTDSTPFTSCAAALTTWRPRSFVYDSLSRLTSSTNPESGSIAYVYDANGNVQSKTAPAPNSTTTGDTTTNYSYDALNRLLVKSYTGGTTTSSKYFYDGAPPSCPGVSVPTWSGASNLIGYMSAMCTGKSASAFSYDIMGRPSQRRSNKGNVAKAFTEAYTYFKDGSTNTITYPSGDVITYITSAAGRRMSVTDATNNFAVTPGSGPMYTPSGLLAGMSSGTGISVNNYYNTRLQPTLISAKNSTATIISLCYDFHSVASISAPNNCTIASGAGDNGNVFQVNNSDSTRSATFQYDPLNRLKQANTVTTTGVNCWGEVYTVDVWGNLTNRSGVPGMSNCITEGLNQPANTNNQLTGMSYDIAGNMINDGNGNQPTYDAENRIATVQGYTYSYDANGNRIGKANGTNGTMYWPDVSGNVLAESDLNGNLNEEYVYFNGGRLARIDRPSGMVHYYFSDHLGSASVITDQNGSVQQQYFYFPYGGMIASIGSDSNYYKFTGKERDSESGLDYFEARHYGSGLGRFMSPDPEQIDGFDHVSDPQSWNGYAYVHNNPLNATDPDGLDCIYIDNDTGQMTGFDRGDCDNSTEEKANSGYYVNGTVDRITENQQGQVTGFSGTGDEPGRFISGAFQPTPLDTSDQLNATAKAIFSQPIWGPAAGTVDLAARGEYGLASLFFPITGFLIDQVSGIDSGTSSGITAAGARRKPGSLGKFKGTNALRRENKMARDIMKDLKLGKEARGAVHEALSEGAKMAGRKLTYSEGVTAVKAALGLL